MHCIRNHRSGSLLHTPNSGSCMPVSGQVERCVSVGKREVDNVVGCFQVPQSYCLLLRYFFLLLLHP